MSIFFIGIDGFHSLTGHRVEDQDVLVVIPAVALVTFSPSADVPPECQRSAMRPSSSFRISCGSRRRHRRIGGGSLV
jgi:hypothetical protein